MPCAFLRKDQTFIIHRENLFLMWIIKNSKFWRSTPKSCLNEKIEVFGAGPQNFNWQDSAPAAKNKEKNFKVISYPQKKQVPPVDNDRLIFLS